MAVPSSSVDHSSGGGESLASSLFDVIKLCRRGGFKVDFIDADGQFEPLVNHFEDVVVDVIDPLDHVNVVERSIKTVKEGAR